MYPRMAAEAKEEGFTQIAALFTMVAAIEKEHEERYKALAANIEAGKVYARETEQVWQCRNCGYVYIGTHAPVKCPVCAHPQAYFELRSQNYCSPKHTAPPVCLAAPGGAFFAFAGLQFCRLRGKL